MSRLIHAFKANKPLIVQLTPRGNYTKPKEHNRLDSSRIFGCDTESFYNTAYGALFDRHAKKWVGDSGLRTNMVQLDFVDAKDSIILDTTLYEYPLEMLLDYIWAKFAVYEEYSSSTKQRAIRKRTTGTNAGLDIRDGRREFIEPVVMIAHNLEYDLGRLIRNHPQFRRVVLVGADTARVMVGKYEIEIAQLTPNGSAPAFEFYVRHNHEVVRLIGRDLWGYLKSSLADIGEKFLKTELKGEVPQEWFKRAYESFTDEERAKLNEYAAQDPKVTRLAYELLIDMLTSIDKHVICKTGLPPRSAPGAGAKMAFAMASVDEWSRPSRKVMEEGALTYAGARVFNRKPGYYENIWVRDFSSMYPYQMTLLPDPATCTYETIEDGKYVQEQWRGQFGTMVVSGRGLDPYYPALRAHDEKNVRLRYVYGDFHEVRATIPEIVLGVESGRLEITHIHSGVHMVGSAENSFLRRFVLKVYAIKQQAEKDSPLYLVAKLLLNALYGKLLEVNIETVFVDKLAYAAQLHFTPTDEEYQRLVNAYVDDGVDMLEESIAQISSTLPEKRLSDDIVFFGMEVEKRAGKMIVDGKEVMTGKAGQYYLPMHGAQITGLASARLGLAAACTGAISGHTDSLFTIGPCFEGIEEYRRIAIAAGYGAPREGLGALEVEIKDATGYLVQGNLYAIEYQAKDKKTGKMKRFEKVANHGIVHLDKKDLFTTIKTLFETGKVTYTPRETPTRLRTSLITQQEPGVFHSEEHERTIVEDPNTFINGRGEREWLPYEQGYQAVQPTVNTRTVNTSPSMLSEPKPVEPEQLLVKPYEQGYQAVQPTQNKNPGVLSLNNIPEFEETETTPEQLLVEPAYRR